MFLGHYALALGARRMRSAPSLGTLVAAAQLPDLIWPVLLLTGIERVAPGDRGFTALSFVHYPWSHSLAAVLVWSALAATAVYALTRTPRAAAIAAVLVASHWLLDFVTHRPDLPLYPGDAHRVGLGLWNNTAATLAIELPMWIAGIALYVPRLKQATRAQKIGFWLLIALLSAIYAGNVSAAAPADTRSVAVGAMAGLLVPVWAYFVDRRSATAPR